MWFFISLPNCIPIIRLATKLWRHVEFPKWRPQPQRRKCTVGFRCGAVAHLTKSKTICTPNLDRISQSAAEISQLAFCQKTAVILKFYIRFRCWPFDRHRHVIMGEHAKFYLTRTSSDGVMMSYKFSKMVAVNLLSISGMVTSDI